MIINIREKKLNRKNNNKKDNVKTIYKKLVLAKL